MKYVIIDHVGLELPIIFPDILNHSTFIELRPVSAGEVQIYGADGPLPDACCCENALRGCTYGKSVSLNLKSRPEDSELIAKELMRHYH